MTTKLVIEQVDNFMVIHAQLPAWSVAFSYVTFGLMGFAYWWVTRKRKK